MTAFGRHLVSLFRHLLSLSLIVTSAQEQQMFTCLLAYICTIAIGNFFDCLGISCYWLPFWCGEAFPMRRLLPIHVQWNCLLTILHGNCHSDHPFLPSSVSLTFNFPSIIVLWIQLGLSTCHINFTFFNSPVTRVTIIHVRTTLILKLCS